MKIYSTLPSHTVGKVQGGARDAQGPKGADAERVVLSDTAMFIQSLRETVVDIPEVREELVEITRADLDAGLVGSEEDYDRAVDALVPEL
jgi:hypothetical protein